MKAIEQHFKSYSEYHQTKGNKLTHYVGIPLIVFGTFGLFSKVGINEFLNLGFLFWILTSIYYIKLDQYKYAIPFCIMSFGVYGASLYLQATTHAVIFIVGWIFQAIGHYKYEKKSPAFLTNFYHLLIGPYWIYRELLK